MAEKLSLPVEAENLSALEAKLSIPSESKFSIASKAELSIPVQEEVVPGLNSNLSATEIPVDLIEKAQSSLLESESVSTDILKELEAAVPKSVSSAGPSRIDGTSDADLLVGTNNNDRIFALGGDDIVIALAGNDRILGDAGADLLIAGGGDDFVDGGSDDDQLFGDSLNDASPVFDKGGNDRLNGGEGNDNLAGGGGNDRLNGGNGDDMLEGNSGNDIFIDEAGSDLMFGGIGNDFFFGGDGDDDIFGEDGNDSLNADAGDDFVNGGSGDDTVFGSGGNDNLIGDAGKDQVTGGPGNDSVSGGIGNDTLTGVDPFIQELGFGTSEIDTLTGQQNNDIFVLGNVQPDSSKAVFYNDGNPATTGIQDYALIADFGFSGDGKELGVDKIQLAGSLGSYSLGSSPSGLPSGTAIFFGEGTAGAVPELVGIVQNVALSNLNLANSNQFTFV